jgi:5-formyltetrahydrofolate cyclo-ligase
MRADQRKDAIRRVVLARRAGMDPGERAARAKALIDRLIALPEVEAADPVLAYVGVRSEVPTDALLERVLAGGRRVLLPTVGEDGTMRAAMISSLRDLAPGYRGIPEPRARFPVDPGLAGIVIAPGVAFDARGGRLGYGGGFYDRFLASAPGVARVGICFEIQIVDEVPMAEHDEPVDIVVTEERVQRADEEG